MNARVLLSAVAALAVAGCERTPPGQGGGQGDTDVGTTVEATPNGSVLPIDHPPIDDGEPGDGKVSADVRRVSLDQLERSIAVVLGDDVNGKPITWMVGSQNGFTRYGPTLGEPDFINTTEENLEPSALYLKFVGDAARDACDRALDADALRTDAQQRVILRHVGRTDTVGSNASGVDQNLRYLKLRFHGVKVADTDAQSIAALRTLFDTVVTRAAKGATPTATHVQTGWHAVCVALITDPEFHLY